MTDLDAARREAEEANRRCRAEHSPTCLCGIEALLSAASALLAATPEPCTCADKVDNGHTLQCRAPGPPRHLAASPEPEPAPALPEEAERAVAFANELLIDWNDNDCGDFDGSDLADLARKHGFIVDVPAGKHSECEWCCDGAEACTEVHPPAARGGRP